MFTGALTYTSSVFFWLYALSRVDLSYAYPFLASSYVLVVTAAWWVLGESVPLERWVGLLVIVGGVVLVGKS